MSSNQWVAAQSYENQLCSDVPLIQTCGSVSYFKNLDLYQGSDRGIEKPLQPIQDLPSSKTDITLPCGYLAI
jgi:hypothetical protein